MFNDFANFSAAAFAEYGTKRNNGKRQEHADNIRNMQKSNATQNALIKTPIDNLQAAKLGFQPSLQTT